MSTTHEFRLRPAHPNGWLAWRGTLARSLYAAIFVGMISGFLTLLVCILTIAIGGIVMQRLGVDLPIVYRRIAPTVAAIVAILAFVANIVWERTHPLPPALGDRT